MNSRDDAHAALLVLALATPAVVWNTAGPVWAAAELAAAVLALAVLAWRRHRLARLRDAYRRRLRAKVPARRAVQVPSRRVPAVERR